MAAVLGFERRADAPSPAPSQPQADASFEAVLQFVGSLPVAEAVAAIGRYRGGLDGLEARLLASVVTDSGDTRAAENIVGKGGKRSKRSRGRLGRRAAAVKKNDALADKVGSGQLSGEQLDVLAAAAERTGGASLTNEALIDEVASVNPDLGKGVIDDFLAKNRSAEQVQSRHDRQRSKRRVSRFMTKDDLDAILIAGDRATIDRVWKHATCGANALYRGDGGRDLPAGQHRRTFDHRMFDAITTLIGADTAAETSVSETSGHGTSETSSDRSGDTGSTDSTGVNGARGGGPGGGVGRRNNRAGVASTAAPGKPGRSSKRYTPKVTTVVPTIVVSVTLDKLAGLDPSAAAELIGTGPIADTVLAQYLAADPNIVGAVFDTAGQPLWLGRNVRLATHAQTTALIVRDKHCVLCGADHTRCVAHHLMPWNAPANGQTDIDKLALVCEPCHRRLHDEQQTLYRDQRSGHWKLRPALPHEIPPPRPPDPNRGQAPQRT